MLNPDFEKMFAALIKKSILPFLKYDLKSGFIKWTNWRLKNEKKLGVNTMETDFNVGWPEIYQYIYFN